MDEKTKRSHIRRQYNNPRLPGSLGGVSSFSKARGLPKKDVEKYLQSLPEYSLFRDSRIRFKTRKFIYPWRLHTFCVDLISLTQYARENNHYNYILVCLDCFSKFLWLRKLKNKSGDSVLRALKDIFKDLERTPLYIHGDQGLEFFNLKVNLKRFNATRVRQLNFIA